MSVVEEIYRGCSYPEREVGRDARPDAILTGEVRRDALLTGEEGRFADLAKSNIVPFVCGLRKTKPEIVGPSHGDEIRSWVESIIEITLIVAAVAGVIASAIAM
jgi:hypothetical protein